MWLNVNPPVFRSGYYNTRIQGDTVPKYLNVPPSFYCHVMTGSHVPLLEITISKSNYSWSCFLGCFESNMVVHLLHHWQMLSSIVSGTHDCDTKKILWSLWWPQCSQKFTYNSVNQTILYFNSATFGLNSIQDISFYMMWVCFYFTNMNKLKEQHNKVF